MDTELDNSPAEEAVATAASGGESVLRRKLAPPRTPPASEAAAPPRALSEQGRLALGRALRACGNLPINVGDMTEGQMPLCELLEQLENGMFLAILESDTAGPGLVLLAGDMATAAVDYQTLARIPPVTDATRRKPTRTDAALVAPVVDLTLAELDSIADPASGWGRGYRFASFMEDPRPINLILDDCDYTILQADLSTFALPASLSGAADGSQDPEDPSRSGVFLLALPVAPAPDPFEAPTPAPSESAGEEAPAPHDLPAAVRTAMQAYPVLLNAILARIPMALGDATQLRPGDMLEVPLCALEQVQVEGVDGSPVATARLGQAHGNRAIRITSKDHRSDDPTFLSAALLQPSDPGMSPESPADPGPDGAMEGADAFGLADPELQDPPFDTGALEPAELPPDPIDFDNM